MKRLLALVIPLLGLCAGSVAATQYLAHTFDYPPELGGPVARVGGVAVYTPWSWFTWKQLWGRHAKRPFALATGMAFMGMTTGLGIGLAAAGGRRTPKPTGAYGTARWATTSELEDAELLAGRGIVLCQTAEARLERSTNGWRQVAAGQLIRHDGPEHAMVFAPTRSGKGIGVVVPTLLSWPGSVIIYDVKRENWELTAGWRSKSNHCLRFEPTSNSSVRFNVLMEVRPYPMDVRDAQNIAEIVVNPDTLEERRDH